MSATYNAQAEALAILRIFNAAFVKQDSDIPDSDLDNEQPKHVTVTLGDLRRLRRLLSVVGPDGEVW